MVYFIGFCGAKSIELGFNDLNTSLAKLDTGVKFEANEDNERV